MQKSMRLSLNGESNRICDILAEMLVEEYARRDASTRCRLSVFGGEGMVMISGSVQSRAELDIPALVTRTYTELTGKQDIESFVHINQTHKEGFDRSTWTRHESGVAYGFATTQTPELLPLPLVVAHQLKRRIDDMRLTDPECHFLGHDGDIIITMDGRRVAGIQLAIEHPESMAANDVQQIVYAKIVQPLLHESHQTRVEIRGYSSALSGFAYASGASGVACDMMLYAGLLPHAGHAFTGTDVHTPARLAVYEARRLAKHLVQSTGATNVMVQLPYAQDLVQTDRVHAITQAGEDISKQVQGVAGDAETLVKKFDLTKAPLRLLAEHYQFVPELAPWEILSETL